jgi:hypothetical protein
VLETAESFYGTNGDPVRLASLRKTRHAEWAALVGTPRTRVYVSPSGYADGPLIPVYANHGRWVADCPFCNASALASFEDPWWYCPECRNARIIGRMLPLAWPAVETLAQVESLLEPRPLENRNWYPDEPIPQLEAENALWQDGVLKEGYGPPPVPGMADPATAGIAGHLRRQGVL